MGKNRTKAELEEIIATLPEPFEKQEPRLLIDVHPGDKAVLIRTVHTVVSTPSAVTVTFDDGAEISGTADSAVYMLERTPEEVADGDSNDQT